MHALTSTLTFMMTDVEEIRQDSERMQQFNAMCHTLKKFAGDELDLPLTPILLSMFGKVGIICALFEELSPCPFHRKIQIFIP